MTSEYRVARKSGDERVPVLYRAFTAERYYDALALLIKWRAQGDDAWIERREISPWVQVDPATALPVED